MRTRDTPPLSNQGEMGRTASDGLPGLDVEDGAHSVMKRVAQRELLVEPLGGGRAGSGHGGSGMRLLQPSTDAVFGCVMGEFARDVRRF